MTGRKQFLPRITRIAEFELANSWQIEPSGDLSSERNLPLMARRVLLIVLGVLVVALPFGWRRWLLRPFSPSQDKRDNYRQRPASAGDHLSRRVGVPQIYADSTHDLYFAQGYVHAQDRLFQLDFQRRVGLGRLSEVLGDVLDTDRFLRTVGTNRRGAGPGARQPGHPGRAASLQRWRQRLHQPARRRPAAGVSHSGLPAGAVAAAAQRRLGQSRWPTIWLPTGETN